jgi:hypothetical protein
VEPVELRHHHIEEDEVGRVGHHVLDRDRAVGELVGPVPKHP